MATILERARSIITLGKSARADAGGAARKAKPVRKSFHAVEIVVGDDCCEVVRRYTGKRFLSGEAPVIPLQGCNAQECLCRYIHHADRRKRERRTSDVAITVDEYSGGERRREKRRGRRATD
jgi:hypothetical protein